MLGTKIYTIRNMLEDEIENVAIAWAEKEGWNPGLYDTPCFYAADPKGFFVGIFDNKPISCISAVAYNQDFAFIGFYITKPEYRGKGYGLKIWNRAMEYLQTQNIGLDGVPEQQSKYMKSGFKLAYSNIRYEGTAKPNTEYSSEIIRLSEIPFDDISKYDSSLFPVPRPRVLQCWVQQPESLAIAAMQGEKVVGYSVIRKCRSGYKIGPLFADSKGLANKLFLVLNNFVEPGTKIYLDTPVINKYAVELAKNYGMLKVFETARMYTKYKPDIDINRIFGVTTFELG